MLQVNSILHIVHLIIEFYINQGAHGVISDGVIMNIFISPKLVVQYIHDKARTKLT